MRHREAKVVTRLGVLWLGALLLTSCGSGTTQEPISMTREPAADVGQVPGVEGGPVTGIEASDALGAVQVDAMAVDRSDPGQERRNPFRFGVPTRAGMPMPTSDGAVPGRSATPVGGLGGRDRDAAVGTPLASTSGIAIEGALSFIGFVESPSVEGRVVVLTNGERVFHGQMGDVVDGRYRIVEVDLESVEIERIDGQGRQTLRLSSR